MIFLGLGGNLPFGRFSTPEGTLNAVLTALAHEGVNISVRSRWYATAPVAEDPQPWYVNGVAALDTSLAPAPLMALLLELETRFGRVRTHRNAPRTVDLDLLAYDDLVLQCREPAVTLPHPRLHERAFVLVPLAEIAPAWRHPLLHRTAAELLEGLPPGQQVSTID